MWNPHASAGGMVLLQAANGRSRPSAHHFAMLGMQVLSLEDMAAKAHQQASPAAAAAAAYTGHAAMVAEGDLTCEVNRFDLLQRGKQDAAP